MSSVKIGSEVYKVIHSTKCTCCADNHKLKIRVDKDGNKRATCPTCGTRYIVR